MAADCMKKAHDPKKYKPITMASENKLMNLYGVLLDITVKLSYIEILVCFFKTFLVKYRTFIFMCKIELTRSRCHVGTVTLRLSVFFVIFN